MLYVSADDTTSSCASGASAHAGPCYYDQYGRPIAGSINICATMYDSEDWKSDVQTALHEMTHITIMISSLWDDFRDSNGDKIPFDEVYDQTVSPPEIISPLLRQTVRDHFDCPTATGLPVQTTSTSHWHERYAFAENMNPTSYSQQSYYSKFTLALMVNSFFFLFVLNV